MSQTAENRSTKSLLVPCLASVVIGLTLGLLRIGDRAVHSSYDLLHRFLPVEPITNVHIVTLDASADRQAHGQLINHLTSDEVRLVVADVYLRGAGSGEPDRVLEEAIKVSGRVVLAGEMRPLITHGAVSGKEAAPPAARFTQWAAGWGVAAVIFSEDGVVRQVDPGTVDRPGLVWAAASLMDPDVPYEMADRLQEERWLKFCGTAQTIPTFALETATNQVAGFFRDKIVFVGGRMPTGELDSQRDVFRTPLGFISGVEVMATAFVNLTRSEFVLRWPAWVEFMIYVVAGPLLTVMIDRPSKIVWKLAVAGLAMVVVFGAAFAMFHWMSVWFPWMVVVSGQIPVSFAGLLILKPKDTLVTEPEKVLVEDEGEDEATRVDSGLGRGTTVLEHELLKRIGSGAYGEVWLARNAVALHHAVKIVHRDRFDADEPYEREFRGISECMPISRGHQGLVDILHVGRDDRAGSFYYVMECADDVVVGRNVDVDNYRARTLATDLKDQGTLPGRDVVRIMIQIVDALVYLHGKGLVHRDLKPANIIFVGGVPQLADIGLIAKIDRPEEEKTLVGTEGYVLLEKAGTIEADLYAAAKILYVSISGFSAGKFPEMPDDLEQREDAALLLALNEVAWTGCGIHSHPPYATATEMLKELRGLQSRFGLEEQP